MGLAEIAAFITGDDPLSASELADRVEEVVATTDLDTTDLSAIGERLAIVRRLRNWSKKEDERLRQLTLSNPAAVPGYDGEFIRITGTLAPNIQDPELIEILKSEGAWQNCLLSPKLSLPLVRKAAKENPKIAEAVENSLSHGRKVGLS